MRVRVAAALLCLGSRYDGPLDAPWHLSVELRLGASRERVADLLADEGMSLRRDREPMVVQQIPGDPGDGWNGALAADGGGATLTLVFNNVPHDGWSGAVGWAEVCPV